MNQVQRWILPLVLVGGAALVASGRLDIGAVATVGVLIELGLFAVVTWQVVGVAREYRRNRGVGLDFESALELGLARIFPRRLARFLALEPRLWSSLFRWLFRRRPLRPNEFRYSQRSMVGAILWLLVFSAPVELFIIEILIPWPILKLILLLVGIYSVVWMVGVYAAMQVHPHRLDAEGLRVYNGLLADGYIPYSQIAAVVADRRRPPKNGEGLLVPAGERAAYLTIGGRTDITLRLHTPLVLHGLVSSTPPVMTLHFSADDPAGLIAALQARLGGDTEPSAVSYQPSAVSGQPSVVS